MGKGIEVCLAGLQGAGTLEDALEAEFVDCLVRQAGLVLVGEKPAALFGFRPRSHGAAPDARAARLLSGRLLVAYAKRTKAYGVRIVWLAEREGGPMLLAWRPAQVARLLDDEAARALMASCGLPTAHAARLGPRAASARLLRGARALPARGGAHLGLSGCRRRRLHG